MSACNPLVGRLREEYPDAVAHEHTDVIPAVKHQAAGDTDKIADGDDDARNFSERTPVDRDKLSHRIRRADAGLGRRP